MVGRRKRSQVTLSDNRLQRLADRARQMIRQATHRLARSPSMRQGVALIAGTTLAYALDYLFNLAAGRLLSPVEFGTLVALAGVGQVLVVSSRVIQTVITHYVAEFQGRADATGRTAAFFRRTFTAAWVWGGVATLLLLFKLLEPDCVQLNRGA